MNISQSQQQSQMTPQRHLYPLKLLATLATATVVSILLILSDHVFQSSLGSASTLLSITGYIIYLVVIATILVEDWRGFLTMNGFLRWKTMRGGKRLIVGVLFLALNVFFLGSYFVQAYLTYRRYKEQEPLRRRRKIAEQEAELGMIPRTEGTCHKCHRPLQLSAEYCVYCGEPVVERPRICPKCYTTTLPDARWCPACGTQLEQLNRTVMPSLK